MSADLAPVVDAILASAEPAPLDPAVRYAIVTPGSSVPTIVEPVPDGRLPVPRRLSGSTTVSDVASLGALWLKYSDDCSELYASEEQRTVTAVFDADAGPAVPRHRAHRAQLALRLDLPWVAWAAVSGKWMTQLEFAEFLEDRSVDVESPSPGEVLDLAQHFEATTAVDFKAVNRTSSSARTLVYEETVNARAGQAGNLEVPTEFVLVLRPFVGGPAYRVVARFRYRLLGGNLSLGVVLTRPEEVLRNAFADILDEVAAELGQKPLAGVAPSPVG